MMDWSTILTGAIGAIGVPVALYLFGMLLPRKTTFGWGYKIGRALSKLGQRKFGKNSWEKIEKRIATTVNDFIEGVYSGLDSDDKECTARLSASSFTVRLLTSAT